MNQKRSVIAGSIARASRSALTAREIGDSGACFSVFVGLKPARPINSAISDWQDDKRGRDYRCEKEGSRGNCPGVPDKLLAQMPRG
jgi:hypothetical protein